MFDPKEYRKKWHAAHPNYQKELRQKYLEKHRERDRLYYYKNIENARAASKKSREKNSAKWNENRRIKYANNEESREETKQKNRDSYQKFRSDRLKKNKQYKQDNWTKVTKWQNEYSKQWYQEHIDQVATNKKVYRKKHPEVYLKAMLKYIKKNAAPFDLTNKEYKRAITAWSRTIRKRDNYTCVKCGSKENCQADHIKPRISNPELTFDLDNGETLCDKCHYEKHGKKKRQRKKKST